MAIIDNDFIAWRDEQRERFPQFFNDLSASRVHMAFREEVALAAFRAGKEVGRKRALSHAAGQEADKPLTADMAKALPGGIIDDTTFDQIEHALDRAGAPACDESGKWLTLSQRIAALASGQEATTNPAEIGRKSVGAGQEADEQQEMLATAMETEANLLVSIVGRSISASDVTLLRQGAAMIRKQACRTSPAQPPASAEVGRDAERYRKLKPMLLSADFEPEDYVGLTFALPPGTCVMANLDSILDGIASSGRNESPIAGVTHGTDEGWGDE